MIDDASDERGLADLLSAPGVIGAVQGSADGELHATHGKVDDGEARVAAIAVVARELAAVGGLLGLGAFEVASLKAPSASRLIAHHDGLVLGVDVDARRPLGELEAQLKTKRWAPAAIAATRAPAIELPRRAVTVPAPIAAACMPPPLPSVVRGRPATPQPVALHAMPPPIPRRPERVTRRNLLGPEADKTIPVFAGELGELALPNLLEFLRGGQRTGTLVCTTPQGIGTVQMQRGLVTAASSPRAAPDEPLADHATADDVTRARTRIYTAFREMMTWTTGRFAFTAEPTGDAAALPPLALSAQTILIQLYQEQDEPAL